MADKRDWFGTCNEHGIPLEDFQRQFCDRCLQPECTRSQNGKSRFETRVLDWEDRLFREVPRMDTSDPRYAEIQAKKFLSLDTGRVPEVRSWVDPRHLQEAPAKEPPPPAPQVTPEPEEAPVGVAPPRESPPPPRQGSTLMNTPNQPRQMIGDKKLDAQPTLSVSDPWEPKKTAPASDGLKVVPPGAKIRLGGSGV